MNLIPGLHLINVFWLAFLYESVIRSFHLLTVSVCIFWKLAIMLWQYSNLIWIKVMHKFRNLGLYMTYDFYDYISFQLTFCWLNCLFRESWFCPVSATTRPWRPTSSKTFPSSLATPDTLWQSKINFGNRSTESVRWWLWGHSNNMWHSRGGGQQSVTWNFYAFETLILRL